MGATKADLENWIEDMMNKRGIYKYELDISGSSVKGDGYLGLVTFVKVIANRETKEEKNYELVIKSAKRGEELRKQTPIEECYSREIFMYTKCFPMFEEFQKENSIENCFRNTAKCYGVSEKKNGEALILENLKPMGYEIHDRIKSQNLRHALYVFQNYGLYHGVSLAVKLKKPSVFNALTKNMTDLLGQFFVQAKMEDQVRKRFNDALEIFEKYNGASAAKKFDNIKNNAMDIIANLGNSNNPAAVILHGDCWNNNMMFKYEDKNKMQPKHMCFIDFQFSRLASPILDLSYYLYSCADKEVLQNFDFLLHAYYSSLSEFLEQFGISSEEVITLQELKAQWKTYGKFGLVMCTIIVKIAFCESDEVVDLTEAAKDGGLETAFDFKLKNNDIFEQRMRDVFEHWCDNFL